MNANMQPDKFNRSLQVDFERITFLYKNFPIGFLGMAISVALLSLVVQQLYSPTAALIWAAAMFITYTPRIIVSVNFARKLKRQEITPENIKPWERYGIVTSVAPFVCYAAVIFFPYQENTQTALLFCTSYAMLLIAGGSLAYSTAVGIMLVFLNINLIALILRCLWEGGTLLNSLAVALIVGYILLTRLILRVSSAAVENISMRMDSTHQSFVDPLTRLWNRRRLHLYVEMLIPTSKRSGKPFCIILMDLDHFKIFNDKHGHQAGDALLVEVSRILQSCAREQDLVVRYGGEEFLIVLPTTTEQEARSVAERIIARINEATEVTISAGLDEFTEGSDIEAMIKRADDALYAAKQAGRNQLILSTELSNN